MPVEKYFALFPRSGGKAKIIKSRRKPTQKSHGEKYGFAEGGYNTKKEAENRVHSLGFE